MEVLSFVIFLTLITSFVCSLTEAVILSVTHAHIEILKRNNSRAGTILSNLKNKIDRPLAAVLTLNTISNTLGGAAVGTQVFKVYGEESVAVATAILTVAILIFAEIIPKTIGARYWKKLSPFVAYLIRWMIVITYPFVLLSSFVSRRLGHVKMNRVTREEMIVHADIGETEGTLLKKETAIIKNVLRLNNISVKDIMTPRSVMMSYSQNTKINDFIVENKEMPFSRIPIYDQDLDHITGMVLLYEIMECYSKDEGHKLLSELCHPIQTINYNQPVSTCLDDFIKQQEHLFLCVDDYGSTTGIVTLEDAVETLLGVEIVDEFDNVEDMRKLALERWEKRKRELMQLRSYPTTKRN